MQWNLIKERRERGLTQKQIADLLEVNLSTYIKKEMGDSQFKANEMFILRNFFDRKIEEIFLPTKCSVTANEENCETTK